MIQTTVTLLTPEIRQMLDFAPIETDAPAEECAGKRNRLGMEIASYAEVHRLQRSPIKDLITVEQLCKHYAFLTGSTMVIVDLDQRNRVLKICGYNLAYRRLEADDWYKYHLIGTEDPPRRVIAMQRSPYSRGIVDDRRILNNLCVFTRGIPTVYILYQGLETIYVTESGTKRESTLP